MSNPNTRKSCVVPKCTNTTTNAPDKCFFIVPKDVQMRKKWIIAMNRFDPFGDKSTVYCCEDHFDIENDMENYIKYKMVGGRIKLKKGIVPHKFKCQQEKEDKCDVTLDGMGRKDTVYRCVRKRKYPPALRKANEARKIQKTDINSCPVMVDIENVDSKATNPTAEVSSADEPLMQALIEIDTTVEKRSEDSIVCKMVRRKSELSVGSAKAKRARLVRRNETEDEKLKRLEKQRIINKNKRARESSSERFKRLNEQKKRDSMKRARMKYMLKSAAFLNATANCSASNDINIDKENNKSKNNESTFETGHGQSCSSGQFAAMTDLENEVQTKAECDSIECRACLQIMNADSVLYNIFESWTPPWDGMENSIAEDLAKIANLQISETDRHSKVICETCCQLLLNACSFTAIVKKNDQILRQRNGDYGIEQNSFNQKVWPKPIQVEKSLSTSMYDNPMNVEIKQEVPYDEENDYPVLNVTYETSGEEIPNLDIIKIEPEEMIQQQPLQIKVTVNGSIPLEELNNKETCLTNGRSDNGECDRIRHNGALSIISMDLLSGSSLPDSSTNSTIGEPQHFFTKNGTISKRKKFLLSKEQRKDIKKIKNMQSRYMVRPGCDIEVCKKRCHTQFTEEERKNLNIFFRNLSWKEQRYFILNNTSKEEPKRKIKIQNRKLPRNKSISYFLFNESGKKVNVCKVFFLETLGFYRKNDTSVRNALDLQAHEIPIDRRGTNPKPSKVHFCDQQNIKNVHE